MSNNFNLSDEEFALLVLACTDGVGPIVSKALIAHFGSAQQVVNASYRELTNAPYLSDKLAKLLTSEEPRQLANRELQILQAHPDIQLITQANANYPQHLQQTPDSPLVLFVRGELPTNAPMISIVGTRHMTSYTPSFLKRFLSDLANVCPNAIIISGLAYGTDITAHQLALEYGLRTVGIVAHGLHTLYPSVHAPIVTEMIASGGGIATEYTFNTKPIPARFVARNRIVAGLSSATIITESQQKGGALITAQLARDYNREVFALPGRVLDAESAGCLQLIESQKARPLTSLKYFLNTMGIGTKEETASMTPLFGADDAPVSDPLQAAILQHLQQQGPTTLDNLVSALGADVSSILVALMQLESMDRLSNGAGGMIRLK